MKLTMIAALIVLVTFAGPSGSRAAQNYRLGKKTPLGHTLPARVTPAPKPTPKPEKVFQGLLDEMYLEKVRLEGVFTAEDAEQPGVNGMAQLKTSRGEILKFEMMDPKRYSGAPDKIAVSLSGMYDGNDTQAASLDFTPGRVAVNGDKASLAGRLVHVIDRAMEGMDRLPAEPRETVQAISDTLVGMLRKYDKAKKKRKNKAPSRGARAVDLSRMSREKSLFYLTERFPEGNMEDVLKDAQEVMDNNDGRTIVPVRFNRLTPLGKGRYELVLTGKFRSYGTMMDFSAYYQGGAEGFTFDDSNVD